MTATRTRNGTHFVYHVQSPHDPWLHKIGVGAQSRVDKWTRQGWTVVAVHRTAGPDESRSIEQDALARLRRQGAMDTSRLEAAVRYRPDGHTEMFDSDVGQPTGLRPQAAVPRNTGRVGWSPQVEEAARIRMGGSAPVKYANERRSLTWTLVGFAVLLVSLWYVSTAIGSSSETPPPAEPAVTTPARRSFFPPDATLRSWMQDDNYTPATYDRWCEARGAQFQRGYGCVVG